MRRLALLVLPLVVAAAVPARADTAVDVIVGNGGPRTLYVEDLAGNELTTLDFGALRTLPFRVRVVDDAFDRDDFTVLASMTNLYRDDSGDLVFDDRIASSDLELVNPRNPLDITGVSSQVQPVLDTVTTIANPVTCGLLSLPVLGGSCTIDLDDLTGKLQTLDAVVNLADTSNLPLVPQFAEQGAFTNPEWIGDTLPAKPSGAPAATQRRLLAGEAIDAGDVLTDLQTDLDDLVAGADLDDLIDTSVFLSAIQDELDMVLTGPLITAILGATTTVTAETLDAAHILYQSGQYSSYPMLRVDVPDDATNGTYRGTLVVTGIQP